MTQNDPARERQAADDANAAAQNSDASDDVNAGQLEQDPGTPLPGDSDDGVPERTPHRR